LSARELAIGVDIGGTKIGAGTVNSNGRVLDRLVIPMPQDGAASALAAICGAVAELRRRAEAPVLAVGAGAAGAVEQPAGIIRAAPNNAYRELRLGDALAAAVDLPVVVENDANVAAVGEARFGAGAGHTHSITITVGTGVGGGIVIDGQLYRGSSGLGGEVGHIAVSPKDGPLCGCGAHGCLETMASGSALTRAARRAAALDPGGTMAMLAGGIAGVGGETATGAARRGDAVALGLFDDVGFWLGVGIASLVNVVDPQIVILAGGVGGSAADLLLEPTTASFQRHLYARDERAHPPIVAARLGADSGLIGAAALVLP